ncbi:MAG: hypothetical protein J0L72_02885 [Armatimonadetes bacterium]|nr:hypothetical protein [Armatimonadota bacterium]
MFWKSFAFNISICVACVVIGGYYIAAQSMQLPGSEQLRGRWNAVQRHTGTSGHRMHNPKPNGPYDLTVLGVVAVFTLYKSIQYRNK